MQKKKETLLKIDSSKNSGSNSSKKDKIVLLHPSVLLRVIPQFTNKTNEHLFKPANR